MEEDNLFGEIDDFLNTTTHAYNDTNPNNGGPPPPAPSHQIVQSDFADPRTSATEANRMTAATKAALGEKLRNNLQSLGGGGEKRKLDAVEGPGGGGGDDRGLGGGDGCEMAKAQKFDGDGSNVDDEFAAFINSPASGAPNSSQSENMMNPPIAIKDGVSIQNQGGGPAAPPGGLLAQALTERKPSNQSGNYALNNFGPIGGAGGGSPGFQQETQRMGRQDPLVDRTLSTLKKYKTQPEELKRILNENPDMRAVFSQIKQAQMVASHGQYNPPTPTSNLQRTANPRAMLTVQQQQQQQFAGNGVGMTENQWNTQLMMPSKVSPPIQRGPTHGGQFGMEAQQQMYINPQQPHHPDMWMVGDQMYSGVPPNRGIMPQPPQQQHHHQMGHPGPPPYPYGRTNVESGVRMGYPGTPLQGDFPGSAAFTRYQPHPGNGAMNPGQRHLPPQTQPPMPPMGSPNGIRMGYDEGGQIQMMGGGGGGGGVRQNMMGGAAALRHDNMAAVAAARGRLSGSGMVRPPLPPTQLGSPKAIVRRHQQDISPPQYPLHQQQQPQHEMVNGGLMNGGNYQVVGGGGGPVYNQYQNQSTHQQQPYNDPHQQQLNERALGIDKFMMQQQQQHPLQPNGSGNESGNGSNDSFNKSMTSSLVASPSNQWKMGAEEHRKIMLSNLHMALREQNDSNLLSMVDSVEAEAFLQCDTQSQYDYRLVRWLAEVLDQAKTRPRDRETATVQPTAGGVQQQQHVSGPPMPPLSDGQPPTESAVKTPVAVVEEGGGGGSTESGNCAGGASGGNFSESSSLSVKNPILANLLPSKSGSDAGDNSASDHNDVTSLRLDDEKATISSMSSSKAAAGPITALTPPSSSESLPSSSPPQTTMASPRSQSVGPVVKYASSSKKSPPSEPSFSSSSSSSSSSLSTPSSNASTASSAATSLSSSSAAPTVATSSSTSSTSVMSTFQSPSSSSSSGSSTFSVPSTGASNGVNSNSNNNSVGRRTSSGTATAGANGMMNKSGNTNPHSVDSGIGSPPRSITSSSLYSPKIQQGTSPSIAAISSEVGASPEK